MGKQGTEGGKQRGLVPLHSVLFPERGVLGPGRASTRLQEADQLLPDLVHWAVEGRELSGGASATAGTHLCSETVLEARVARGGEKSPQLAVRPLLRWALGDWGEGGNACMKLRAFAASQYPWHVPGRWAGSVCQCLAELAAVTPSRAHFIGAGRESGEPNVPAKDSEARGLWVYGADCM